MKDKKQSSVKLMEDFNTEGNDEERKEIRTLVALGLSLEEIE